MRNVVGNNDDPIWICCFEAYASRFSMEKAQEIAAHLVNAGKDGVRVKPESLEPSCSYAIYHAQRCRKQR